MIPAYKQVEVSYRRGLLLGFTMAEVVILVVFVLLLALGALLVRQEKAKAEVEQARNESAARLAAMLEKVKAAGYTEERIDDIFHELRLAQERQAELNQTKAVLAELSKSQQEIAEELKLAKQREAELSQAKAALNKAMKDQELMRHLAERLGMDKASAPDAVVARALEARQERDSLNEMRANVAEALGMDDKATAPDAVVAKALAARQARDNWNAVTELIAQQDPDLPPSPQERQEAVKNQLVNALELRREILDNLRAAGMEKEHAAAYLEKLPEMQREQERTIANQRAQIKNLTDRLGGPGKGTEKPPCWAAESGAPEYIFDVRLTSGGLILKDNALPHRAEEQARLPLDIIQFSRTLSPAEFRRQTRALLDWSNTNECRFFVRVYDSTGPAQKSVYKRMLRIAGEHFYYFEPAN